MVFFQFYVNVHEYNFFCGEFPKKIKQLTEKSKKDNYCVIDQRVLNFVGQLMKSFDNEVFS
jgi:hypothetical protein